MVGTGPTIPIPPSEFVGSTSYENFPTFPPCLGDGLLTTPAGEYLPTYEELSVPFGGVPSVTQIGAATSATVAYLSPDLPSNFAQYWSIQSYGIAQSDLKREGKLLLQKGLKRLQDAMVETGALAGAAMCSAWAGPDGGGSCGEADFWFSDGGYTDGPSMAMNIAQYQAQHPDSVHNATLKVIISNNNYYTNTLSNILQYFNTTFNQNVLPGGFLWAPGAGGGMQLNPWQSQQIFGDYMDDEMMSVAFVPIDGTNLTIATFEGAFTTVDNPAFGVQGGQKVSLLIL